MPKHQLTPLQIGILRELWACKEATVSELWERLHEEHGFAPTTLATILSRLERRGVVAHRTRARRFIYRPTITVEDVRHRLVEELTASVFGGDAPALINHLLTSRSISSGDLARIRAMVEEAEGRLSAGR